MASQGVDLSDSDSVTSQSECDETETIIKKPRTSFEWQLVKTFESKDEAVDFIKELKEFKFNKRYNTHEGEVFKYVCKQDRSCASRVRLVLESRTSKVLVQKVDADHDHKEERKPRGTPLTT